MSEGIVVLEALGRACRQGGLALFLVWALCRLLPRLPGRTQCWLWRLAYLKLLVALLWTTPLELPLLPAASRQPPVASRQPHVPTASTAVEQQPGAAGQTANPDHSPVAFVAGVWRLAPGDSSCLLLLWLLGVGWFTLRVWADWRRTQRLRGRGSAVRDEALAAECWILCLRLGIQRAPDLLTAPELDCPVLVGVARPAVVLPASFPARFPLAQLRLMLAHELAHLQRRDLVWAWLPNLGRVLFFFHPLVWLAEGEWRLAQEMACDEQVVRSTGVSHAGYGAMLLEVMGQPRQPVPAGLLTVGVAESYATLRRRLAAIRQIPVTAGPQRGPGIRSSGAGTARHERQGPKGSTARRVVPPVPGRLGTQRQRPGRRSTIQALAALLLSAAGAAGVIPWRLTPAPAHQPRSSAVRARSTDPHDLPVARIASLSPPLVQIHELRRWRPGPVERGRALRTDRSGRPASRRPQRWAMAERLRSTRAVSGSDRRRLRAGAGIPQQRHDVRGGIPGTSPFRKEGPGIAHRVIILAELPPKPVDPDQDSASRPEPLYSPFAVIKMPKAEWSRVLVIDNKLAVSAADLSGSDLDPMAFEQKRLDRTRMLLVPKPVAEGFSLFAWKPSPPFRPPSGPEVRIDPAVDPAELKRRLGEAFQQGAIDPGAVKKLFALAAQSGGIDPRALKKMLAQARWKQGDDAVFFDEEGLPAGKKLLHDEELDQQKREMEKQRGSKEPTERPFTGLEPDF